MRPLSEYTSRILEHRLAPPGDVGRTAHRAAARRAAERPWTDATLTRVIGDLAAQKRFGDLPLGRVDPESWARREELARLAIERLEALATHPGPQTSKLIADHVALDLEVRYPALSDPFQAALDTFERDWGYRQAFSTGLDLPALRSAGAVFALQRETGWPATRVADGAPSGLGPRADSRTHRLPHHVTVMLHQGVPLVELWLWPHADDAEGAGWVHAWFVLQDRRRLVPVETARAAADILDPAFLPHLEPVAASAIDWHDVLVARYRSVFGPHYQRDGMPVPAWRADAPR